MVFCLRPGFSQFPKTSVVICWLQGSVFLFTACFSHGTHSDPVCWVFVACPAGYSQKRKSMSQETMHYQWWWEKIKAARCYDVFTFDCKILCFGFNKITSQKFAHLSSSCLPYGSKLHLANGITSSCPSDFHVQSYITMFMGGVCWSAEGGSAEKCLFCIPVFFLFFLFPRKFFSYMRLKIQQNTKS